MYKENLNDTRSSATKARLINSTIESLVEIGFTKTTGVEVCRRAQLTRGALNHHFPDFSALLVETLQSIYLQLLEIKLPLDVGLMEYILLEGHARIIRPEFKAVIELWLASKNDKQFGLRLVQAMELGSEMFSPQMVLEHKNQAVGSKEFEMIYRTISEALIGIGLGRAIGEGEPLAHESMVLQVLQDMAQTYDHQQST
ncbi:MAG: TetR/AcrR family transcriptional regulator [Oceanicoccus sp.]